MRQFNGYKAEKAATRETLPAGGYVAKILDAREIEYSWGFVVQISFDIEEGEKKGFFNEDYQNNTKEDKKWRGVYRLVEPKDDGSEKDEWTKRTFNNAMYAIEQSNPGYHWDWNEKNLKNKLIGVIFRNKEWEYEGKTGWTTECGGLTEVKDIRKGTFKQLADKPLKNKPTASASPFNGGTDFSNDDCPF